MRAVLAVGRAALLFVVVIVSACGGGGGGGSTGSGEQGGGGSSVGSNPQAPQLISQPASQSLAEGQNALFSVIATGSQELLYQWLRNGVAIAGATGSTYLTPPVTFADNNAEYRVRVSNSAGSMTSAAAIVTVFPPAAKIVSGPANVMVQEGGSATFSVTATALTPISYQWNKDGVAIPGATSSSYAIASAALADSGSFYSVDLNSGFFVVSTAVAELIVVPPRPPAIAQHPRSALVALGSDATFSVSLEAGPPATYQWRRDGVPVPGATNASFEISPVRSTDNGTVLDVIASNVAGSTISKLAVLRVDGAAAITPGWFNMFAQTEARGLFAWGANDRAQLGDGGLDDRASPIPITIPVLPGAHIVSVSADIPASLAVASDGGVWTWGGIGVDINGANINQPIPTPVQFDSPVKIVKAVLTGGTHIALDTEGNVWGWGSNSGGILLGDDGLTASEVFPPRALDISGSGKKAVDISAGTDVWFLLTDDGEVYGRGRDTFGQLGIGSVDGLHFQAGKVAFPTDTRIIRVAPAKGDAFFAGTEGQSHTLWLDANGEVWAAGYNGHSELGQSTLGSFQGSPGKVQLALPTGVRIVAIAAGDSFSLALASDNTILAWGLNSGGQLGDGGAGGTVVATPTSVTLPLPAGVSLVDIAAGELFAVALASDGTVWTWGSDFHGTLGDGPPAAGNRSSAAVVPGLDLRVGG